MGFPLIHILAVQPIQAVEILEIWEWMTVLVTSLWTVLQLQMNEVTSLIGKPWRERILNLHYSLDKVVTRSALHAEKRCMTGQYLIK